MLGAALPYYSLVSHQLSRRDETMRLPGQGADALGNPSFSSFCSQARLCLSPGHDAPTTPGKAEFLCCLASRKIRERIFNSQTCGATLASPKTRVWLEEKHEHFESSTLTPSLNALPKAWPQNLSFCRWMVKDAT